MQRQDPLIGATDGTPVTDGFQLQLGPDGRCRLVLLGAGNAPIATLTLDAAQADRLAQELASRRQTYADKAAHPRGAAH